MSTAFQRIISLYQDEFTYYDQLHAEKYRDPGQTRVENFKQISERLSDDNRHADSLFNSLIYHRFLPAGRIQAAFGASQREVSPFNCSVSQRIDDDIDSIFAAVHNAAKILRLGTGVGYNFSHLRPSGALISKLQTNASGPLSFMRVFDAMASTISSSGHRRGAQMGILNVDHPDIEEFIDAKMVSGAYRYFNLSVGISDEFMGRVSTGGDWLLHFNGRAYKTLPARELWDKIIRNAYDSAEPGIIFIDRLNNGNNLHYCETIEATNPCAEQPLPPYGLCCLGSFNLPAYLKWDVDAKPTFNYDVFHDDIQAWVQAYDNIFERAVYAIPEHAIEAKAKRRIGLGFTGIANCCELLVGHASYGSDNFISSLDAICRFFRDVAYRASVQLAKKKGHFPLFTPRYIEGKFIPTLPEDLQTDIACYGIRNSHLISFAPCGTISQCAFNVSSGVEPVFHFKQNREVYLNGGKKKVTLHDFNYRNHGFEGKTLKECTINDHLRVATTIQTYCDSSISKTINVPYDCSLEEYKDVYTRAYDAGLKGITIYRPTELRGIVIQNADNVVSDCPNGICNI
jgi:ribonucleoside-diphosphate reductase alpha chain